METNEENFTVLVGSHTLQRSNTIWEMFDSSKCRNCLESGPENNHTLNMSRDNDMITEFG